MSTLDKVLNKREAETTRITVLGLLINIALVIIKLGSGFLGNSRALIADAMHSFSDLGTDIITLIGVKWGSKPADEDHHYGHQKIESLAQFLMGLFLVATAIGIGFSAGKAIYFHEVNHPGLIAIFAAALSVVSKEVLYRYTIKVGDRWKSQTIIANAWHHRSDSFSSIAVLLGVGAAYFIPSLGILDAYASILVSFLILKIGMNTMISGFKETVDTAPSRKVVMHLHKIVADFPGVTDHHNVKIRPLGSSLCLTLHICVKDKLTVEAGHEISVELKEKIMRSIPSIIDVLIHVEPHSSCSKGNCFYKSSMGNIYK